MSDSEGRFVGAGERGTADGFLAKCVGPDGLLAVVAALVCGKVSV